MGERPAGRAVARRRLRQLVPGDGNPGLAPAQLPTVCVLQSLLDLSDRQVAEAVRCRIDFKYALAMELDDFEVDAELGGVLDGFGLVAVVGPGFGLCRVTGR
ncbi:transposase [Streptomyces sp. NPDC086549]|uniref:transposase n=1 Tax=Streptomyces sp. NPDC086549 TaxID=3365752 RepID=UPI0037F83DF4